LEIVIISPYTFPVPILSAANLIRSYPLSGTSVNALRGVSLEMNAGDFFAIMGPSGC
jgi:putative ABC transport system ATP-binding protein